MERTQSAIRRITEIGLILAICIAIGVFGGTEPISRAIYEDILFTLSVLLLFTGRRILRKRDYLPVASLCMVIIWVFVQWLASSRGRIGFDTHRIETCGLAFAAAVAGFFLALEVCRSSAARRRLALALVAIAGLEAIYGFAQYPGGWQYVWAYHRIYYTGSATGTYVNHNHFAGLLEMILPVAIALAAQHWEASPKRHSRRPLRSFLLWFAEPEILKSSILLLISSLLLLAIVFSFSRMGLLSTLAALCVLGLFLLRGKRSHLSILYACVVMGFCGALWVGAGPVAAHFERLRQDELSPQDSGEGRIAVWKGASTIIRQHPFAGVGLGCFEFAFTRVQSAQLTLRIEHAHNDYLELTAELGIPAAAALVGLIGLVWARAAAGAIRARSASSAMIGSGAVAGVAALLVHSAADFNLYIPANALVFAVLLGIGYSISRSSEQSNAGGLRFATDRNIVNP